MPQPAGCMSSVKWSDQSYSHQDLPSESDDEDNEELFCSGPLFTTQQVRVDNTMKTRCLRTSRHIISFYQLFVKYDNDTVLPVVADSSQTIEYLRAMIEAVYAFNFTTFNSNFENLDNTITTERLQEAIKLPLVVALLCNEALEPLNFDAVIEDVLHHGDTVVIGACQNFTLRETMSHEGVVLEFPHFSEVQTSPVPSEFSMENEFYFLLHNRKLLSLFKEFCLSRTIVQDLLFWMDVEVLRTLTDESISVMGKYIFATYIAQNAPMKINIPNEIKVEVVRLAKSSSHTSAFDEAQFLVYDALKCIVFPRFKETPEYSVINSPDIHLYKISTPYAVYFPPDKSFFLEICDQYEKYSDIEMPMYLREVLLNQVINRYFPEAEPTLDYFETIQAVDQQQRSLKLQREKKLRKFFGVEDPTARGVLSSHLQTVPSSVTYKVHSVFTPGSEDTSSILSAKDSDPFDVAPNVFQKKKRADKLESFFGVKPDNIRTTPTATNSLSNLARITKTNSLPSLVNENDIPSDVKQTLTRRSRKIRQMLGDGVESDLNALILDSTKSGNISRRYTTSNAHDVENTQLEIIAPTTPTIAEGIKEEETDINDISKQLDQFLAGTHLPEKETAEEDDDVDETRADTKGAKVKRREKLQQLLGQGKLPSDTPAVAAPVPQRHASVAETERARRQRRKQSTKIEKLLGEVPSNFALSDVDRKTLAHQHFIDTISMMLQRKDGLSRIMNYIVQDQRVDQKPPPQPPTLYTHDIEPMSSELEVHSNVSVPTLDEDAELQRQKLMRQKKFKKLSKFFGGSVDPELLIEQRILSELERKIENDLPENDDSLVVLKGNLQALREQVKSAVEGMTEDELGIPTAMTPVAPTEKFLDAPEAPLEQSI